MPPNPRVPVEGQRLVHKQYTSVRVVVEQVGAKFVTLRVENTQRLTNINKLVLWEHYELLEKEDEMRSNYNEEQGMLDVADVKHMQIIISADGRAVWVNTETGCLLRVCRVESLEIKDERK